MAAPGQVCNSSVMRVVVFIVVVVVVCNQSKPLFDKNKALQETGFMHKTEHCFEKYNTYNTSLFMSDQLTGNGDQQ